MAKQKPVVHPGSGDFPRESCGSTRGVPLFLEKSQRLWQPPPYLRGFVCDCLQSGRSMSQVVRLAGNCRGLRGSCAPKGESNICKGRVVGGINLPTARCPSHLQQPRCPAFSHAAVVKARRMPYETYNFTSKRSKMLSNTGFRGKSPRSSIPTDMETSLLTCLS